MRNFINLSNHPSKNWNQEQQEEARKYGEIIDYQFPAVSPYCTEAEIDAMAEKIAAEVAEMKPAAVMCQGEYTLCFALVLKLKAKGLKVVASCSDRATVEEQKGNDTVKTAVFKFIRFREY